MSISWPGPLQTPRLVDIDVQRKKRIMSWLRSRWDAGADMNDTPQLLLEFEHFLQQCEAERMSK